MSPRITSVVNDFVARIEGIDVATALVSDIDFVKTAMQRYAVAVLPGQHISEEQQIAFARQFGELDTYPEASQSYSGGMRNDLLPISNVANSGAPIPLTDRRRFLDIGNKFWHSDSSFKAIPAHLSMLYGIKVASAGGHTQFADMRAAYDALSDEWKTLIEGLVAEHSVMHSRQMLGFDDWDPEHRKKLGGWVAHDIVRTLPESGRKSLYLSSHASHIVGLPIPVGRMLLHELTELATQPEHVYSHDWEQNDFVIWDNRCTMHRLKRYRAAVESRVLRRATTLAPEFPARDPATVTVPDWKIEAAM